MVAAIDLNADLGEQPDAVELDAQLLTLVTSANVACGGHAGDSQSMLRVTALCVAGGVAIGAHVSYPDRAGFGRRPMATDAGALAGHLHRQLADLRAAAAETGGTVAYIKAHGALYNAAVIDDSAATVLVDLAADTGLPLLTIASGRLAHLAAAQGVPVFSEFFADRAYEAHGGLRSRQEPGAVITQAAIIERRIARLLREGVVATHDGTSLPLRADSICVHGDTAGAVAIAQRIRDHLAANGVAAAPFTRAPSR